MNDSILDVLIVGGGPIGLACGIEAHQRQLDYLIVEKGCLVNSIYNYPANMTFFSTSEKIEIGRVPFVSHSPRPTRSEALEYYRRVRTHYDLHLHTYERVEAIEPLDGIFHIHSNKASYRARSVVLATGFFDYPNRMNVPGEDLPKVKHYYEDPHPFADSKVLVVGAANSAIDAALETWRKGAEVTLVHRGAEVSSRVKYWIRPDILNRIKEGSIPAYFHSQVAAIREGEVDLQTPEGLVTLENDFVLAMTGFHPDFGWLERIGVNVSDDEQRVPQRDEHTFETNVPNLYLAGTICGGMNTNRWFIENSIEHAATVMEQIKARLEGEKV
jgi:thioredoxin reductase (NADPH)